jgi:tetratricopeptide (TPR) repeat protein
LIGSKRYRDALALLKDPATGFGHYAKAQALLDTGSLQDAVMESGKAVELEPANARYLLLEGQLLERANDAHAIAFIDRAIAADPNWFEPRYSRAVCSYLQRDYHAAELELAVALRTNTRCARCLFLMGVVHFNRGEWAMAVAAFRQAISIEPENARFYMHFGVALFSSGCPAQAEAALRKAISLDANYSLAHFQFGKLLARTARLKQAARELEESRSLDPHLTQASYQLAKIYAKLGDRAAAEHALAEFREQKANATDDPALRNDLAFSLLQ